MSGWFRTRLPGRRSPEPTPSVTLPALTFRSVERTLALFIAGLTDGALVATESVEAAERGSYTDGRTVYLPPQVAHAATRGENLALYRATIGHAAAQIFYGTLVADGGLEPLRAAPDVVLANAIFDVVEGARLAGRLTGDFPGIGRDLAALGAAALPERPPLAHLRGRGQALEAIVRHTLDGNSDATEGLRSRQGEQLRRMLADLPANGSWGTLERRDSVDLTRTLYERIAAFGEGAAPSLPPGRSRIRLDRI